MSRRMPPMGTDCQASKRLLGGRMSQDGQTGQLQLWVIVFALGGILVMATGCSSRGAADREAASVPLSPLPHGHADNPAESDSPGEPVPPQDVVGGSAQVPGGAEGARAAVCFARGYALSQDGRHAEAIESFDAAISILQRFALPETKRLEGLCHLQIGNCLNQLDIERRAQALQSFDKALALFQSLGDDSLEPFFCMTGRGWTHFTCGDYDAALRCYEQALAIAGERDDEELQAEVFAYMSEILLHLQRYEEAIEIAERALAIYGRRNRACTGQHDCELKIGIALSQLGLYEQAAQWYRDALEKMALDAAEPPAGRGSFLKNLGTVLAAQEEYVQAVEVTKEAVAHFAEASDADTERAECFWNIGTYLFHLDRYDESLEYLNGASKLLPERPHSMDDVNRTLSIAMAVARTRAFQGHSQEAMSFLLPMLEVSSGHIVFETAAGVAESLRTPEMLAAALRYRWQAVQEIEKERTLIQAAEHQMAWFERRASVYEETCRTFLDMRERDIDVADPDLSSWKGRCEEAALHFADRGKARTLLGLLSESAANVGNTHVAALLADARRVDDEISALLKERGVEPVPGQEERFERQTRQVTELQSRQREMEAEFRRMTIGPFVEPALLDPVAFCRTLHPDEAALEYVAVERELIILLVTQAGVKAFRVPIARDTPPALRRHGHPDMDAIVAAYLGSRDVLQDASLETLTWLQRAWMEHQDKRLAERDHITISQALTQAVLPREVRQSLAEQKVRHLLIVPSRMLGVTSFAALVLGGDRDEPPQRFADCRFLVEDYSVSYLQSLSLLIPLRERLETRRQHAPPRREFLAMADPVYDDHDPRAAEQPDASQHAPDERKRAGTDALVRAAVRKVDIRPDARVNIAWNRLPETRREAEDIARLFGECQTYEAPMARLPSAETPATVCVGFAANRPLAKSSDLGQFRHVYFGVHGHSDMSNPWLSSLMLTDLAASSSHRQPAPLTLADVIGMELSAQTVMLAACETAMGRMRVGEGVIGFQLALLAAGADSVVLTQWQVPSAAVRTAQAREAEPTREIVCEFYRNLHAQKTTRAEALRQGQLKVLCQGGDLADPFYWGAWQLFGEWR